MEKKTVFPGERRKLISLSVSVDASSVEAKVQGCDATSAMTSRHILHNTLGGVSASNVVAKANQPDVSIIDLEGHIVDPSGQASVPLVK